MALNSLGLHCLHYSLKKNYSLTGSATRLLLPPSDDCLVKQGRRWWLGLGRYRRWAENDDATDSSSATQPTGQSDMMLPMCLRCLLNENVRASIGNSFVSVSTNDLIELL